MKKVDLLKMIRDLDENKVSKSDVKFESIKQNEVLDVEKLTHHLLIIESGTLHLENKNFQILHFFSKENVIHQSPFELGLQDKLRLVTDTPVKIIFINREYFLNFAANKMSYMEWLLEAIMKNSSGLCFELMKYDLPTESRITYTMQKLCDKDDVTVDNRGFREMPRYMNKMKLAKYGGVSRKNLDLKLEILKEKKHVEIEEGHFLISQMS
ncbi:Crp/Fnr family transcriptional regulator [Listeria aquatica]|uniref:Crp/Fnr family transcriptional regulator n=1 Tax=Listeria aquatica TaxID=1494960 RepID=UPI003F728379